MLNLPQQLTTARARLHVSIDEQCARAAAHLETAAMAKQAMKNIRRKVSFDNRSAVQNNRESARMKNYMVHFSSATDLHATPQVFFDRMNAEFGFTIDVCATTENAKCAKFYTKDDDRLSQHWEGIVWMNPPYGREICKWMRKANESAMHGATVVCLVPARTDTNWWHEYAIHHEIRFIRGRLKFGTAKNSAPFPSAVIVMKPPCK